MNRDNLSNRLQAIVIAMTTEYRRFKQLETLTGLQADSWKSWFHRRQRPTAEMIEAVSRVWPEYAFWLATGVSDAEYGHVAPGDQGYPRPSPRKENSAALFRKMLELKAEAEKIAINYLETDDIHDIDPNDSFVRMAVQVVLLGHDHTQNIDTTEFRSATQAFLIAQKLRRAEILVETEMPQISYEATETLISTIEGLLSKAEGPAKTKFEKILIEEKTKLERHKRTARDLS